MLKEKSIAYIMEKIEYNDEYPKKLIPNWKQGDLSHSPTRKLSIDDTNIKYKDNLSYISIFHEVIWYKQCWRKAKGYPSKDV